MAIDTLGREIYFYGYGNEDVNPFYYRVYKANIDKEGATLISKEDGQHNAHFCSRDVIMLILIHE